MRKTLLFLNIIFMLFIARNVSAQYDVLLGSDPSCVAYSKDAALCVASSDDAAIISYFVHQDYRELYSFSVQNPTQSTSIKLPDRMWINDMVRLEENHNTFHIWKCLVDGTVKVSDVSLGIMSGSHQIDLPEPAYYHSEIINPTSGNHTIDCQNR